MRDTGRPRVFGAFLMTETNSFSSIPTTIDSFRQFGFFTAETELREDEFLDIALHQARDFFESRGGVFLHGLRAMAQPGAPLGRADYEYLVDQLLRDVRRAPPLDIVFLGLHGAMMSEDQDDCEGDILGKVREIVGEQAVIGAFLDPHAHLSEDMCRSADLLVFSKEYPHTDLNDRASDLATLCWRTWCGEVKPAMSVLDLGLIGTWPTQQPPVRGFVDRMYALERESDVLSVSFVHGFPWGDSPDVGSRIVVITDDNRQKGDDLADSLAKDVLAMRDKLPLDYIPVDEALDRASAIADHPVVLADVADNPGGGAGQDSTFILRRALQRDLKSIAFGAIYDPVSVAACFDAGIGADISLSIGGKSGSTSGESVEGMCTVMGLSHALMQSSLYENAELALGDSAWVRMDEVDIVLCSERNQIFGLEVFTGVGIDPLSTQILVVKSSNHFYHAYKDIAAEILYVTTPGALNMDLDAIPYTKRKNWGGTRKLAFPASSRHLA